MVNKLNLSINDFGETIERWFVSPEGKRRLFTVVLKNDDYPSVYIDGVACGMAYDFQFSKTQIDKSD